MSECVHHSWSSTKEWKDCPHCIKTDEELSSIKAKLAEADYIIEDSKAMLHKDAAANMPTLASAVAWSRNEIDRLLSLNDELINALQTGLCLNDCFTDYAFAELMSQFTNEARAAIAAWDKHNAPRQPDTPLSEEIVGNDTIL